MIPVEPVSLTIGAVALASLFSLCVQCFDLIEVGCNLGLEYELLIVKLSIEKRRLMIWGEAVGVLRPDEDRDQLLDEPETHQLIERILMNIQKMFHDADALRSKYGLEKASDKPAILTVTIEGSVACSALFENSPLAQFQKRVSGFHQKAGLMTKTRWAIRDNGKFIRLITNLKDLLDGLYQITTSARTSILKGHLIRQETESISDLRTLKIIEESCSDADWKSCASAASSYLNSIPSINFRKREYIHEWMESDQDREVSSQIQLATEPESRTQRHDFRPHERAATLVSQYYDHQRFEPMIENRSGNTLELRLLNGSQTNLPNTEVLIMCSTTTLVAWIPPGAQHLHPINNIPEKTRANHVTYSRVGQHFHPINNIPETTRANHMTYSRIMKAIIIPREVLFPCITIYCPPRMRYVHLALRFIGLESTTVEYRCQIRFDDRLLDKRTSFDGIAERMMGYHQEISEAADTIDPKARRLVDAIDMNWLEQRIDYLTLPSHRPLSQTLDWYTIFRQSKDEPDCVGIIIMAGDETCRTLFNTAPVTPPDNFRGEGRVYRLRELQGATDQSKFRWKAEHYCNISVDEDFERLFPD